MGERGTQRIRRTARVEGCERIAELIGRARQVGAAAQAARAHRRFIGKAQRQQLPAGGHDARGEAVTDVGRRVDDEAGADPLAPGEAAARVVERQIVLGLPSGTDLQHQIGQSAGFARLEGRLRHNAGEFRDQQYAAFEGRTVNELPLFRFAQQRPDAGFADLGRVADINPSVAPFEQAYFHDAVPHILGRHQGTRHRVAPVGIKLCQLIGARLDLPKGERQAGWAELLKQHLLRERGGPDNAKTSHMERRRVYPLARRRWCFDTNLRRLGGGHRGRRHAQLLLDSPGVGPLLSKSLRRAQSEGSEAHQCRQQAMNRVCAQLLHTLPNIAGAIRKAGYRHFMATVLHLQQKTTRIPNDGDLADSKFILRFNIMYNYMRVIDKYIVTNY